MTKNDETLKMNVSDIYTIQNKLVTAHDVLCGCNGDLSKVAAAMQLVMDVYGIIDDEMVRVAATTP